MSSDQNLFQGMQKAFSQLTAVTAFVIFLLVLFISQSSPTSSRG